MVNIHLLMKRKGAIAEFFFEPIDQQVKYIEIYHPSMHFLMTAKNVQNVTENIG